MVETKYIEIGVMLLIVFGVFAAGVLAVGYFATTSPFLVVAAGLALALIIAYRNSLKNKRRIEDLEREMEDVREEAGES